MRSRTRISLGAVCVVVTLGLLLVPGLGPDDRTEALADLIEDEHCTGGWVTNEDRRPATQHAFPPHAVRSAQRIRVVACREQGAVATSLLFVDRRTLPAPDDDEAPRCAFSRELITISEPDAAILEAFCRERGGRYVRAGRRP